METQRTRPMYKAHCKAVHKEDKDETWPNYFSFPPRIGDFVKSESGKIFKIISITHTAKISKGKYGDTQFPKAILGLKKIPTNPKIDAA
ncbi:MAG: hypothetical protein GY699_24510 [Desulfobacteraceae bacterium]|nr:hypothetical protein [Desulfobacteraceae bacterium]